MPIVNRVRVRDRETGQEYTVTAEQYRNRPDVWDLLEPRSDEAEPQPAPKSAKPEKARKSVEAPPDEATTEAAPAEENE